MLLSFIRATGRAALVGGLACATLAAGTFGRAVAIGGHASDIALDEGRGVLYIANFTANRIEVMSLADLSIPRSINVNAQPSSVALSRDGRFLVVAHYGNFDPPVPSSNVLTIIDLNANTRRILNMNYPAVGVSFGLDNLCLVATTRDFELLEPATGSLKVLTTVGDVAQKTFPVPLTNFPPNIVAASLAASGDGKRIYGITGSGSALSDTLEIVYDVETQTISAPRYISSPPQAPRVVSVARDGSYYVTGWTLNSPNGYLIAQFPNPNGVLNIGSHAIDSDRGLIYAQVPEGVVQTTVPGAPATPIVAPPPFLMILDADNLTVRERLLLPENLAGKSILNSGADVMYSISDSGLLVLPVGSLNAVRRVVASQEDLVFRGNFCDRRVNTQEITITDPGGGATDFSLSSSTLGLTISPTTGRTPARVRISVDPEFFTTQKGTVTGTINIRSTAGVNIAPPIRLLINNREPDQRGTFVNVPGKLVDVLADPGRNRFYVLRQDKNQVLVFDGSNNRQIATLRTSNTPTQMAVTLDRKYLLVGHDNSWQAYVFDLDTLQPSQPILFPGGHYPRSLAAAGDTIIAAARVAGPIHQIDRVDFEARVATPFPTLGVYKNDINIGTVLVPSPNGRNVMAAMPDGNLMLYDASADTFTISRKDSTTLGGTYAASASGQFLVENNLLNSSLVVTNRLDTSSGATLGFAFSSDNGLRFTSSSGSGAGTLQKVDLTSGAGIRPTKITEAPLPPPPGFAFIRTLAPLSSGSAIIGLTQSGFTILPPDYDAPTLVPRIDSIVNSADNTRPVAPGGLISVLGGNLSSVSVSSREIPLPTVLAEACLEVNGDMIPLLLASPGRLNAQLPFETLLGGANVVLRTPGGISNFTMTVLPNAPAVFRSGTAGSETGIPLITRGANNTLVTLSNPVHKGDELVIYATGLGRTSPAVESGVPAPSDPLAGVFFDAAVVLGHIELPVTYAGLAPGEIGVYQINVRVPQSAPQGLEIPMTIFQSVGITTLSVRVVD